MSTKHVHYHYSSSIGKFLYFLVCTATAMIGYQIHHSVFYSILNFIFAPLSWLVWLVCHDVNMTIIHKAFDFLFS